MARVWRMQITQPLAVTAPWTGLALIAQFLVSVVKTQLKFTLFRFISNKVKFQQIIYFSSAMQHYEPVFEQWDLCGRHGQQELYM